MLLFSALTTILSDSVIAQPDYTAIILAILSVLGNIILGSWQFIKDKKKIDSDAMTQLLGRALEMNKQELEVVRLISQDLQQQIKDMTIERNTQALEIKTLKIDNERLNNENESLKKRVYKLETSSKWERTNDR